MLTLLKVNAGDLGKYAFATQFDVKDLKTYNKAISGAYIQ